MNALFLAIVLLACVIFGLTGIFFDSNPVAWCIAGVLFGYTLNDVLK